VGEARLTYLGHSTVLIELGGTRLLTDPILRPRVGHLRRRDRVDPGQLAGLDAVLVSHGHMDHLDRPSLFLIDPDVTVVVPRGLHPGAGRRHVTEVDAGESVEIGAVRVEATHAEHDGRRIPVGPRVPALGYLVHGDRRVFFAGDTDLFDGMSAIGAKDLDVALLPVWGWGGRLPPGHLTPLSAAHALERLRPRLAIPIHWGTLAPVYARRSAAGHAPTPPLDFVRHAATLAPDVKVVVLQPGESLSI
jgi:L-ascorbate metabolism protein UlaG (beta-lactamase superfamily)